MLSSNEPIKLVHLQKIVNQPILNGALVISTIFFMKARKNSLEKTRNVLIKKTREW